MSDRISEQTLASSNVTWFGLDTAGHIGAFETAGFAWMHPCAKESESARLRLIAYFQSLPATVLVVAHLDRFAEFET